MATLQDLQTRLTLYKAAETNILSGAQEYRIGEKTFRRANLVEIQKAITDLETRIAILSQSGRISSATVVFGGRR